VAVDVVSLDSNGDKASEGVAKACGNDDEEVAHAGGIGRDETRVDSCSDWGNGDGAEDGGDGCIRGLLWGNLLDGLAFRTRRNFVQKKDEEVLFNEGQWLKRCN
jgi:hypothetical protein